MMLSKSAQIIQDVLIQKGTSYKVIELPDSTRTAKEAADALGCSVAQIVKSLIFRKCSNKQPILILVSGSNRVDEKIIENLIGEKIERADADYTRQVTGYAIGGIPPFGHKEDIATYIDEDLLNFNELWDAAGTPHAVFNLQAKSIANLTNGKIISIKKKY